MSERDREKERGRKRELEKEQPQRTRGGFERKMPCNEPKGVPDTHTHIQPHPDLATHTHTHGTHWGSFAYFKWITKCLENYFQMCR